MRTQYRLSNPTLGTRVFFSIPDSSAGTSMSEAGTLVKSFANVVLLGGAGVFAWRMSQHISPEVIIVFLLASALVAAFTMVFPMLSAAMSPFFSALLGFSLGSVAALASKELSGSDLGYVFASLINISVVVSAVTLACMLVLRRLYLISTIDKVKSIIFGGITGFLAAFAAMKAMDWAYMPVAVPFYFDSVKGYNVVFGAAVALLVSVSTIYHMRLVRQNEHRSYPKYMEWYMALGMAFSLVWFYNECLNYMLGYILREDGHVK